ncbi:MAG: hypothetical protein ACR2OJ_16125 [Hyphomicrobiales bacterium]
MNLLEELEETVEELDSFFQKHLMREDIQRIKKLTSLAENARSLEEFEKAGFFLGWTQHDLRTPELAETLNPFLRTFYAAAQSDDKNYIETEVKQAWIAFTKNRLNKLVRCL